jgi:predicted transcriptional regulator
MRSDPPVKKTPSDREWNILDALWDLGSGTVAEVRRHINEVRELDLAHTTVLTNLRALEAKGWVRRSLEGRAHRYQPTARRGQGRSDAISALLDSLFEGSPDVLVDSLIRDCRLHLRVVRRLREVIDRRLRELER